MDRFSKTAAVWLAGIDTFDPHPYHRRAEKKRKKVNRKRDAQLAAKRARKVTRRNLR